MVQLRLVLEELSFASLGGSRKELEQAQLSWNQRSWDAAAKNPWDDRLNVSAEAAFVRDLISVLRLTLSSHFITLVGGEQLLFCRVWSSPIQVYLFSQQDEDS